MRLRAIDHLFDPVDPSPFGQQELSQWAAEYIVESVKEMQAPAPSEIVMVIDQPCDLSCTPVIGQAVRGFFARQALLRRRSLHRLLRRRPYRSTDRQRWPGGRDGERQRGPIDRAMGE
jgi:hypothetical protein